MSNKNEESALRYCVNCIGMHPDEEVDSKEVINRLEHPQKLVALKKMSFEAKKLEHYAGKFCTLCGRSYDVNGDLDETWKLTAKEVSNSFQELGIKGFTNEQCNRLVANCLAVWKFLWKNRATIAPQHQAIMTFSGRLNYIICKLQLDMDKRKSSTISKEAFDEALNDNISKHIKGKKK